MASPRKIVTHVLLHEVRHWAQIATLFRLNGLKVDFHDSLFSPMTGGELRREPQTVQTASLSARSGLAAVAGLCEDVKHCLAARRNDLEDS